MPIAAKIREAMREQSWIRQMFELGQVLKREYGEENVFDLALGNPILEPPPAFYRELRRLAEEPLPGMHRYMPNAGYAETRQAVADQLTRDTGLPFRAGHVVMTCGAGGAINVVLKALLDPGDEVIVLAPYFPEYLFYADNHGAVPRIVPTDRGFQPDLAALKGAISAKTKVVLLNSPNNPTGVVYSAERLRGLGQLLRKAQASHGKTLYLVSDEPYARLVFDGLPYPRPLHCHPNTIVATSYSKDLSLPGERIGYIAVHPECAEGEELLNASIFANRILGFVNAPALMQHLIRALQGQAVEVGWYQRRRDRLCDALTSMGYTLVRPQGAFYAFPASPIPDDVAFVQELLKWRVVVTPGRGFGAPGHFRISYAVEDRVLEGALEGLHKARQAFS